MTTPDILLALLEFMLLISMGILFSNQKTDSAQIMENQKVQNLVLVEHGKMLARLDEKLNGLPIAELKADIKSNRHKIAQLDKAVSEDLGRMGERLTAIESRCALYHQYDQ